MSTPTRVVVILGPVSANLDLLLRREGLIARSSTPTATTYGPPALTTSTCPADQEVPS